MKILPIWNRYRLRCESILVDDENYDRLKTYTWNLCSNLKKTRTYNINTTINGKGVSMANIIFENYDNMYDHIDRNPFNNQKNNFRVCDHQQNSWNSGPRVRKYKGVSYWKRDKNWSAQIMKTYKKIHLGYFDSEIEAAKAYDEAAKKYFGEFAYLNFPNAVE